MSSPAISFRPIEPGDRGALADAFERLSPESRFKRFLGPKNVLSERELTYFTEVDHVDHEAYVAVDDLTGDLLGVARYALGAGSVPDFAVVVADAWQGRGLGRALARRVIARAGVNGFTKLTASTMWENDRARCLLSALGFRPVGSSRGVVDLELALVPATLRPGSVGLPRWSSVS
jgi:RimJ/RimL family protein N-acetyltransferase